jgi:hypothetical protein
MNRVREHSNTLRVGIYRDIASPWIDINSAVIAIDNLHKKFGNIALAETDRLVQLTSDSKTEITTNSVNWLETSNHLNFVLTNRRIFDRPKAVPSETFGTVGMSVHRPFRKPYVIIDSFHAPHLLENIVQHESAHLVKVKDSGTYYDHGDHCNHPKCLMQPIAQKHLKDFCAECSEQLDERLRKLSRLEIPGANLFRKALRFVTGDNIKTVRPIDEPLEHNWI